MTAFHYADGVLHAEAVPLTTIGTAVRTPAYVYSAKALRNAGRQFQAALADIPRKHIAFAVKANPNRAVLYLLAQEGFGADIVSGGGAFGRTGSRHAARRHHLFGDRENA
jgi:diaminopimelate decarboxylase